VDILQQCLAAGLLDEIQVHLVPILLGDGVRLFDHPPDKQLELETTRVIESPAVTHLKFRVPR
jgi:dihydrofolate reductase